MELKTWLETVDYRITEGSEYGWKCYGPDAYCLDSVRDPQVGSASVVFDRQTQTVYEVVTADYVNNRAYRMIHPDWREAYTKEALDRNQDPIEAWDTVQYVDLDVEADWNEKTVRILGGENYDTRVVVEVDWDHDTMFQAMAEAHRQDITLNQLVEQALIEYVESQR